MNFSESVYLWHLFYLQCTNKIYLSVCECLYLYVCAQGFWKMFVLNKCFSCRWDSHVKFTTGTPAGLWVTFGSMTKRPSFRFNVCNFFFRNWIWTVFVPVSHWLSKISSDNSWHAKGGLSEMYKIIWEKKCSVLIMWTESLHWVISRGILFFCLCVYVCVHHQS